MLFSGPPFWLHIGFLADFEMLPPVSIYYKTGIELERYTIVRTHLQSSLFYYLLFLQTNSLERIFSSLNGRRCVSEIHSTLWSRRLSIKALSRTTAGHDDHSCRPCRSDNRTTSAFTSAFVPDDAQVPLALGFIMSVLGRRGAIELRALATSPNLSAASTLRPFSVLNRPPPNYPGHVPLTTIERGALAIGSAIGSLINPRRAGAWI